MTKYKTIFSSLIIASFLVGCGGGSTNSDITANNLTPADTTNSSDSSSTGNSSSSSTDNSTGNSNSTNNSSTAINDSSPIGTVKENGDGTVTVKYYKYKTGRIVYSSNFHQEIYTDDGGSFLGDTEGTKTFLFKDYGNVRIEKENSKTTTTLTVDGQPPIKGSSNDREFTKYVGGKVFDVKFDDNEIIMTDLTEFVRLIAANPQAVEDSLTSSLTGEVVASGEDNLLGFPCEIFKSAQLNTTVCLHEKNLTLYSTIENPGANGSLMTLNERAISAEFNINIDESEFALPNYPVIDLQNAN